jgi:hypothetical protein
MIESEGIYWCGFTAYRYWSGTTVPSNSANAYYVSMIDGYVSNDSKPNGGYVRCVR